MLSPLTGAAAPSGAAPAPFPPGEGAPSRSGDAGAEGAPLLAPAQFQRFQADGVKSEDLPMLLRALGNRSQASAIRTLIQRQSPYPARDLVKLLTNPSLAVRLGALDLLELAAQDTFGFDPWLEPVDGSPNKAALEKWRAWSGQPVQGGARVKLDEQTCRAAIVEFISGSTERFDRAIVRLAPAPREAIAFIERFLKEQPLEESARAALKCAQYRLLLEGCMPRLASRLARQLVYGGSEERSTAAGALAEGGRDVIPILAGLLDSPDSLVRETAVDSIFAADAQVAPGIVLPLLAKDEAENVIHAILRGAAAHPPGDEWSAQIVPVLSRKPEDIVVAALEALGAMRLSSAPAELARLLSDERWRVRAAAVETAGSIKGAELLKAVKDRLADPDTFVRTAAATALCGWGDTNALDLVTERFFKDDELKPVILALLLEKASRNRRESVPEKIWKELDRSPPDVILSCLDTFLSRDDYEGSRAVFAKRFTHHANLDVRASALRILASKGKELPELAEALESGDPVVVDAVLDALVLPQNLIGHSAAPVPVQHQPASARKSPLDALYGVFVRAGPAPSGQGSAQPEPARQTASSLGVRFKASLNKLAAEGSPQQRARALTVLFGQGDGDAARQLLEGIDALSSLDRAMLGGAATGSLTPAKKQIFSRLLRDPAPEVREKCVAATLDEIDGPKIAFLLEELAEPRSLLQPDDIYGWEMDRLLEKGAPDAREWALRTANDPKCRESVRVLALVILGRLHAAPPHDLDQALASPNAWLRRAACRAGGSPFVLANLKTLANDESPFVRAAIPFVLSPHSRGWLHHFDDGRQQMDSEDFSDNVTSSRQAVFGSWANSATQPRNAAAGETDKAAALYPLLNDPSDVVRFEALFALLRLGQMVNPRDLIALIPSQPKEAEARYRLGVFVSQNFRTLDREHYRDLAVLAADRDPNVASQVAAHFGVNAAKPALDFASLAFPEKPAPAAASEPPTQPGGFKVLFFVKPGCKECARVTEMLREQNSRIPQMNIANFDIGEPQVALMNEVLSRRAGLPQAQHLVAPSVFTHTGALVGRDIDNTRLGDLLRTAASFGEPPKWASVEEAETKAAGEAVRERFQTMSWLVVAAAGALDGINPCAFATIIFLLSYLQVARRSPREILAVGGAFVLAVFLSYLAVGFGLSEILARIGLLAGSARVLNLVLGLFALCIAVLSLLDARKAAKGDLGGMRLQLPESIKERIRGVVRTGARARRFVVAAFAAGVLISFLELACTGQVYLPTIQYMLKEGGRHRAVALLLVYNIAFVAPLIAVFGMAFAGLRSETLIAWQRRNAALVKLLTAGLFFLLAFVMLGTLWFSRG